MDRLGVAGLRCQRDRDTASNGGGFDLCRYALFTLVGIAGEDDLDAPDLPTPAAKPADWQKVAEGENEHLNDGEVTLGQATTAHATGMNSSQPPNAVFAPEASKQIRDRLIAEVANLLTGDDAALWAHRRLGEKNKLIAADAGCVECAFAAKLTALGTAVGDAPQGNSEPVDRLQTTSNGLRSKRIDKSLLRLPETRRVRDREHVKLVAQQPCLVCGRRPSDAHHPRFAQNRAMARKASDEFLFRSVAVTTARSTALGTKPCGGEILGSIRSSRPAHCGSKVICYLRILQQAAENTRPAHPRR
jgi:hypothetical protein